MSFHLYLTADDVGSATGGGIVTAQELTALSDLGMTEIWARKHLETVRVPNYSLGLGIPPWEWDQAFLTACGSAERGRWDLAHVYSGTFPKSVPFLKSLGVKVTYTAAAHNIKKSQEEHVRLGIPYVYPHLTEPVLLDHYLAGYRAADVVVCPSRMSADIMRGFGCQRVEVIPHGTDRAVSEIQPLPGTFTVGYLGATGPDKGLRYLLEAWRKLDYHNEAELLLAGKDSQSPFMQGLVRQFAPNTRVQFLGWVENVSDFYNNISLYVQPSVTEGFGIEVLEAMAHGRVPLVSDGAGAVDCLPSPNSICRFPARDVDGLAERIHQAKHNWALDAAGVTARNHVAAYYTWDLIRAQYQALWRSLL
jgi:glycosyltransferase involved in cell wall biosynthesis